jgi:hypothetical protein
MGDERRKYLSEVYLKKVRHNTNVKKILEFRWDTLQTSILGIPEDTLKEIKEKYDIKEYLKRAKSIISKHYTEEELSSIIEFYSSPLGQKITNQQISNEMDNALKKMIDEMETSVWRESKQ